MRPNDLTTGLTQRCVMYAAGITQPFTNSRGEEFTRDYRVKIEATIRDLDGKIVSLFLGQPNHEELLAGWGATMRICLQKYREIDRNLESPFPEWNLPEVIGAITFLEALRKTAEFILLENGIA